MIRKLSKYVLSLLACTTLLIFLTRVVLARDMNGTTPSNSATTLFEATTSSPAVEISATSKQIKLTGISDAIIGVELNITIETGSFKDVNFVAGDHSQNAIVRLMIINLHNLCKGTYSKKR